jgi:hypothetical protein
MNEAPCAHTLSANVENPQVGEVLNKGEKFQRMGVLNAAGRLLPDKTPLYASPNLRKLITVDDVTEAMVKDYSACFSNVAGADNKSMLVAAYNAVINNLGDV